MNEQKGKELRFLLLGICKDKVGREMFNAFFMSYVV